MHVKLPQRIMMGGGSTPTQKLIVTITGTGNENYGYVIINGTKFTSAATVEVELGTIVECRTTYRITLNGTSVGEEIDNVEFLGYNHTVTGDCTIAISSSGFWYFIDITT